MCIFCNKKKYKETELNVVQNEIIMKSSEECAICLEYLNSDSCIITNCNHFFHKACIDAYIQNEKKQSKNKFHCPYCRKFQFKI